MCAVFLLTNALNDKNILSFLTFYNAQFTVLLILFSNDDNDSTLSLLFNTLSLIR